MQTFNTLSAHYGGPPKGVKILSSQDLVLFEASDRIDDAAPFPPLAMALRIGADTYEPEGFRH